MSTRSVRRQTPEGKAITRYNAATTHGSFLTLVALHFCNLPVTPPKHPAAPFRLACAS